jgi:hypothetical protein
MSLETRDEVDRWLFEKNLVEGILVKIERTEHAILERLGCPTDPEGIYRILAGEVLAPWPARTAKRDQERAKYAMHCLVLVRNVRNYLGPQPEHENPRLAAYWALLAGGLAGDLVKTAEDAPLGLAKAQQHRETSRKGGRAEKPKVKNRQTRWRERVLALRADKGDRSAQQIRMRYQEKYGTQSCPSLRTIQDILAKN